jgi:hypothetical protein
MTFVHMAPCLLQDFIYGLLAEVRAKHLPNKLIPHNRMIPEKMNQEVSCPRSSIFYATVYNFKWISNSLYMHNQRSIIILLLSAKPLCMIVSLTHIYTNMYIYVELGAKRKYNVCDGFMLIARPLMQVSLAYGN